MILHGFCVYRGWCKGGKKNEKRDFFSNFFSGIVFSSSSFAVPIELTLEAMILLNFQKLPK